MDRQPLDSSNRRVPLLYALLVVVGLIFTIRLFYLQIIKHEQYRAEAEAEHESKFVLPAERGAIYALDGDKTSPLVLNQNLPTIYADPRYVTDPDGEAKQVADIIGGKTEEYAELLKTDGPYVVLKKRVQPRFANKLKALSLPGIGTTDASYRVYPQHSLAAQVLGFVNDEGAGQYGVEQYLNEELTGEDGRLKAITDVHGIPLASTSDNVLEEAQNGSQLTLSVDINIQREVEAALARGVRRVGAPSGSAIVYDPHSGAIKAMANYPSFDPSDFTKTKDWHNFQNAVVSDPYETGSGMKMFTMSTGLNEGAVTRKTTFFDSGSVTVDGERLTNAEGRSYGRQNMDGVIEHSVNTGVIYVLSRLGGGELNARGRETLYNYFTKKFGFGSLTGVEQANESTGVIADPNSGVADNVHYANMAFGQGLTVTMVQTAAAAGAILTGDYYQPYLVQARQYDDGRTEVTQPKIVRADVVSTKTSTDIRAMLQNVVKFGGGYSAQRSGYFIGGKTGSAQIPDPNGGYIANRETGSFTGFGASHNIDYVIMTRVNNTTLGGYAGSRGAAPIFADISNYLINYYQLPPGQ